MLDWPILMLAAAISIDGFAVGIAYGLREIRMGFFSLLIISSISTLAIYLTGGIGVWIAGLLQQGYAELIGSIILFVIGGWLIYSAYINLKDFSSTELLFSLKIKPLGIIINVLKEPVRADLDNSGTINYSEAVVLGLALALDAMGAGLGVGLSGFAGIYVPLFIGVFSFLFLCTGYIIGHRVGDILPDHFGVLPGFIIIILGIIQLIR
jgi:putative sporulation protein YtaF